MPVKLDMSGADLFSKKLQEITDKKTCPFQIG
jgi:hypothetical protein